MAKSAALTALLAQVDGPTSTADLRKGAVDAIASLSSLSVKTREQKVALENAQFNLDQAEHVETSDRKKRIRYASIALSLGSADKPSFVSRLADATQQQIASDVQTRVDIASDVADKAKELAKSAGSGISEILTTILIGFFVTEVLKSAVNRRG